MKRAFGFVAILLVALGCLYFAQRHPRHDAVSPNAIVDVAADWQHDLTRAPMHVTRIPDDEEVRIGENMAKQYEASESSFTPEEKALDVYVNQVGRRVAVQAIAKTAFPVSCRSKCRSHQCLCVARRPGLRWKGAA